MVTETKFLAGVGIVTALIITAGIFLISSKQSPAETTSDNNSILYSNVSHAFGNPESKVKVVEFSDFQCPACGQAEPILKSIIAKHKDSIYFVYRHYPLPLHKNAKLAAKASEAAAVQGKFWEMHDFLFANQPAWSESDQAEEIFIEYARSLNIDAEKFKNELLQDYNQISNDRQDGDKLGVNSTPTFFINGQIFRGVIPEAKFEELINQANSTS